MPTSFFAKVAAMDSKIHAAFAAQVWHYPVMGEEAVQTTAIVSSGVILEEMSPGSYAHLMLVEAELTVPAAVGDVIRLVDNYQTFVTEDVRRLVEGSVALTVRKGGDTPEGQP